MAVLARELLQLLTGLVDELLQLFITQFLQSYLVEDRFVESTKSRDDRLSVLANLVSIVDSCTNLFDCTCLLPQLLKLLFVHRTVVSAIECIVELFLLLSQLDLKLTEKRLDLVLLSNSCLVVL